MTTSDRDQTRDGKGRYARTLKGAQRDAEACRLRSAGQTYQAIADELGYGNPQNARRAIDRTLAETVAQPAGDLRTLELIHLDELRREAYAVMRRPHLLVNAGKVVMIGGCDCDRDAECDHEPARPLADDKPILESIDRLLKIGERRAKLVPELEVPTRVETDSTVRYEVEGVDLDALA